MGTLGQYLRSAREAQEIDLRDAAQQTRISINYLRALEEEDFSKLPGEVFVRGFLKNYSRYLNLDDAETLKKYAELKPPPAPALPASSTPAGGTEKKIASLSEAKPRSEQETPIEPFIWGAVIFISLLVFLFTSLPGKDSKNPDQAGRQLPQQQAALAGPPGVSQPQAAAQEKLYLEVIAVEDTWLLVRTDTSPQKKAVLKKGESLIWSADERFLLTYGRIGAVKLLLNGADLEVKGTSGTLVRDLVVTRTGIINQPSPANQPPFALPKPRPAVQVKPAGQPPAEPKPSPAAATAPAPVPSPVPAAPAPPPPAPEPEPAAAPAQ